ncbi:MAG: hypothetical protein ACRDL6_12550 [Solirubrobacterales bacterium]
MSPLPSKEELIERERRWLRPAGLAAIGAAVLYAAGFAIGRLDLPSAGNDAELLELFDEHAGRLIASQVVQGIAIGLFAAPLYFLFRSVAGRTERVRRSMVAFAFIGPALYAFSAAILATGLNDVAGEFVERAPAVEREARQEAEAEQAGAEQEEEEEQSPDEAVDEARDDLATDVIDESGTAEVGANLRVPAILGLIVGLIYIPLWAMRTGLLTRFWATLGMALGVSLVFLGLIGLMALVLWILAIGLILAGWWPGGRPPAWAEGRAIPWLRPGEEPDEDGPGGAVEGSGRELAEPPLPEEGAAEGKGPDEAQGQRRKKRKRRS